MNPDDMRLVFTIYQTLPQRNIWVKGLASETSVHVKKTKRVMGEIN